MSAVAAAAVSTLLPDGSNLPPSSAASFPALPSCLESSIIEDPLMDACDSAIEKLHTCVAAAYKMFYAIEATANSALTSHQTAPAIAALNAAAMSSSPSHSHPSSSSAASGSSSVFVVHQIAEAAGLSVNIAQKEYVDAHIELTEALSKVSLLHSNTHNQPTGTKPPSHTRTHTDTEREREEERSAREQLQANAEIIDTMIEEYERIRAAAQLLITPLSRMTPITSAPAAHTHTHGHGPASYGAAHSISSTPRGASRSSQTAPFSSSTSTSSSPHAHSSLPIS